MKYVLVLFFLFVASADATPLDYTKEVEVAYRDVSISLKKGNTEKLRFALERLTISCNMIELEGESLPSICVRWLSILKKGCGLKNKEKSLKVCARKLHISKKTKSYAKKKVARTTSSPPPNMGRAHLTQSLFRIYSTTQDSFNRQYRLIVRSERRRGEVARAVRHLDMQWGRFLHAYHYYSDAVAAELNQGDRREAAMLIERLKIISKRMRTA